jgi:hypothetical protein
VDEKVAGIEIPENSGNPSLSGEGENSISIGTNAGSTGESSIAIGPNSYAVGVTSIALGAMAVATNIDGLAIGCTATAENNSLALGHYTTALGGSDNVVIGQMIDVIGNDNIVIGNNLNIDSQDNRIIIGDLNHTNITLGPLTISFALNKIIFTKGSVSATLNLS